MSGVLLRRVRTSQPTTHVGINESHPSAFKVLDGWLAHSMQVRSCRGRAPNAIVEAVLTKGRFGVGISAKSGGSSIKYNVGAWGESGSFAFLAVCEFIEYTETYSIVRLASSCVPVQIAAGNVRGVPWSPVDTSKNYFGTWPSGVKLGVFIANRVSQSTFDLWSSESGKVATTTSLTGYGTTGGNPLCFMGTESNTELATSSSAKFYGGVAFNKGLTDTEINSFLRNPWQLYAPETVPLFWSSNPPQIVYPNGDVAGGAWLPSTGTDLYACIDETSASDTDYIYTTVPGAYQEFTFPNCGAVDPSTGGHVRYRIPAGTGTITAILKQGSTTLQTLGTHTLTGSAQDIDITISASVADSDDLRVGFTASA